MHTAGFPSDELFLITPAAQQALKKNDVEFCKWTELHSCSNSIESNLAVRDIREKQQNTLVVQDDFFFF